MLEVLYALVRACARSTCADAGANFYFYFYFLVVFQYTVLIGI